MKFPSPVSAQWISQFINAEVIGDKNSSAKGINEIHKVNEGDIVFVDHPKYYDTCINSAATFIIINKKTTIPEGKTLFITDDPFEAYLKIVNHFRPFSPSQNMISDTAVIGKNTIVMP
ncbi:MAG: LpxD N-terminal domain-containing protein, partial [Ginsengibacter sp.]